MKEMLVTMRKDDLEDDLDGYFTWQELALVNKQEALLSLEIAWFLPPVLYPLPWSSFILGDA